MPLHFSLVNPCLSPSDLDLNSESLGRKLSELRLYCDVLTQQVLAVQEATHPQDNGSPLDIQVGDSS